MRRVLPLKIALASVLIAACVTINVYFPAAAADKAATDYWNDVAGGGAKGNAPQPQPQTPQQSSLAPVRETGEHGMLVAALGDALYALVPAAHAQNAEAALNVSSPAVNQIRSSMKARFGELPGVSAIDA